MGTPFAQPYSSIAVVNIQMTNLLPLFRTDMRIQDNFKLIKKIGSGAFGEIYKSKSLYSFLITKFVAVNLGTNAKSGKDVAFKLEHANTKFP